MKGKYFFLIFTLLAFIIWIGCSTAPTGSGHANKPPQTYIANVPPAGDTVQGVTLIYWFGVDDDGFITYYEWAHTGDSVAASSITTWDSVAATDDTMKLTIDDVDPSIIVLDSSYDVDTTEVVDTLVTPWDTFYVYDTTRIHEYWHFTGFFYVRSYDNEGLVDPTPAVRGWNVVSEKPRIELAASDTTSGLMKYYDDGSPIFWAKTDTAVVFVLNDTTALWKGLEVWWSRADTLNITGNDPSGYRYRIDNGSWQAWTDESALTMGDSFISFTGPISDGYHWLYLQGRNASHIESDIDSLYFKAVNSNFGNNEIIVSISSAANSAAFMTFYQTFMPLVRPNATIRYIDRPSEAALTPEMLQGAALYILIRDDFAGSNPVFLDDSLILYQYALAGGHIWTFGLNLVHPLTQDTSGCAGSLLKDILGIQFYENSMSVAGFDGAHVSNEGIAIGLPQDTLWVDPNHTFPPNASSLQRAENLRSSDPKVDPLYYWIGLIPWNGTPVAMTYYNPELNIRSASFGFSGHSINWDGTTYEPLLSIYDAMLTWFGL